MAVRNKISVAISIFGLILGAGGLSVSAASLASADSTTTVNGCTFEILATAWTLQSSCNSTGQINVPTGITLDGGNFTISPTFAMKDSSLNAAVGILGSSNVTIHDLTIDGANEGLTLTRNGAWVPALHGINIYNSTNVKIDHVTVKNMGHTGINVNSSTVSVSDVTTSNNGWHGIDVDQKVAYVPSVLNIIGSMEQTDASQIFVDNTTKAVTVNDIYHQYAVMYFQFQGAPAAAYILFRTGKESCKDGGWNLGLNSTQSFKNQGLCVAFFAGGDEKSHSDESGGKSKSGNNKD